VPTKFFSLLLASVALACSGGAHATSPVPPPSAVDAGQLVVVVTDGWDANQGHLQAYARTPRGWVASGPGFAVAIGRNGSAWGSGLGEGQQGPRKREGDGRSPAGVFDIGTAFGYTARIDSQMPYRQMQADSWCMDVPTSPLYNRIVQARDVGAEAVKGSTEAMRLDLHHEGDPRYREGFVIAHNPDNVPEAGSCIFAHLWRTPGETTAGCTAMAPADMQRLMHWLQPARTPRFVLLPRAEYARVQGTWQLPALEAK
jgi:L,D-peptidoglycan transpeptidase YkuD (ErfK/YbiS/YcfS/YnhG family)